MGRFVLVRKKERWSTTWLGKLLLFMLILLGVFIYTKRIYPFLAVTEPFQTDILVIEGFMPDYAIEESMKIFYKGNYRLLIITGKQMAKGQLLSEYDNDGTYTAAILEKSGFDNSKIEVVELDNDIKKDRTYASAVEVARWIANSGVKPDGINLVSLGCHSRRSRLLFKKAFDDTTRIGIISVRNLSYDPETWWRTSNGVRDVFNETIAWIYARFFFWPNNKDQ
jgi:uncharacterized SAM-binding protein YcdF (DUF218 family)